MTRQLTITAAEWASVHEGTLWLVREGGYCEGGYDCPSYSHVLGCFRSTLQSPDTLPPAEFVEACAPCETCGGSRCVVPPNCDCDKVTSLNYALCTHPPADCPVCRIELVGPCKACGGRGWVVERRTWGQPEGEQVQCSCDHGTVTLGWAWPVGQPLPIVARPAMLAGRPACLAVSNEGTQVVWWQAPVGWDITAALAHYGPPETLVGRWALQLRAVGS